MIVILNSQKWSIHKNKLFYNILCCDTGHCKYHPEVAKFDNGAGGGTVGKYSCCDQDAVRFDPTQNNNVGTFGEINVFFVVIECPD